VEAAGAQLVAVHGRTREQKRASDVRANWGFINEIKKALKVPVLANGDMRTLGRGLQPYTRPLFSST
jgi:tRNA-dihydrouridine synthase 1